jgi:hypothetical protein
VICTDILQFRYWIFCNLQSPTVSGRIYSSGKSRGRPLNWAPKEQKWFYTQAEGKKTKEYVFYKICSRGIYVLFVLLHKRYIYIISLKVNIGAVEAFPFLN